MFDLMLRQPDPSVRSRRRAVELLGGVVQTQARLIAGDVHRRRMFLKSEIGNTPRRQRRILQVDLERAEALSLQMQHILAHPGDEAAARLDPLLQLLAGPLVAIELSSERLGARISPEQTYDRKLRALLLPDTARRRRVQIQNLQRADPKTLQHAMPRCYGELGQSYIAWSLNRLDFRSLMLVVIAYLRMN